MTEGQERAPAPYWPALSIDGQAIDLTHLEPFQMDCNVQKLDRTLTIDVRFSNHCFTDHFEDGVHELSWMIMDHKVERVFCRTRYGLSAQLPHMVRSLSLGTTSVRQTRHERNYVHYIEIEDPAGGRYPMFFTLKKAKATVHQIIMMVESAYPVTAEAMGEIIRTSNKVSFPVLCAKVFRNEPPTVQLSTVEMEKPPEGGSTRQTLGYLALRVDYGQNRSGKGLFQAIGPFWKTFSHLLTEIICCMPDGCKVTPSGWPLIHPR